MVATCTVSCSLAALAVAASLACLDQALAMSTEEAKAKCHDQFVPIVQQCVRKKVAESGGSPYGYIPGCRAAIMDKARECIARLLGGNTPNAEHGAAEAGPAEANPAEDTSPAEIDVPAPAGRGRVVIVMSGIEGTSGYVDYAWKVAKLGYYTVILDGKDMLSADPGSEERLQKAIARAQSSPDAVSGKVAVIGFSMGGAAALTYAERRPDLVSIVIAYYPVTSFISKVTDMNTFVGKFQVPVLAFAGAGDTYHDCCLEATIRTMEATAKAQGKPMELIVYPDAGHNFIKGFDYKAEAADDAWRHTTETLNKYFGSEKGR